MSVRFAQIVIDAHDTAGLAAFWAEALGYHVTYSSPVSAPGELPDEVEVGPWPVEPDDLAEQLRQAPVVPTLTFLKVPEDKVTKNRLHIDLRPTGSQEAEVERVIALGARRVDIGQGEVHWVVLADPEGNEFCILRALA